MLGVDALALAAEDLSLSTLLLAQSQPGHATLERGRYLVKAGDCETGHTLPNGMSFTGRRVAPTSFGDVFSTNIIADDDTAS